MSRATFWNIIAKRYARNPVADQPSYETKLAMTKAILRPQMRVLEVGCGTGTTALYHAPSVAHIDAIDFSPAMIAVAQGKADAQAISNVTFRVAALANLPTNGATYDVALALSLLHLLDDPAAGLREIADRVKPEGYVVTSTACLGDTGGFMVRILPWIGKTGLLPKVVPLTKDALIAAHAAAGLQITETFRPRADGSVFLIAKKTDHQSAA
ncbi:Methyltransferase domain-containing protein [Yoonia tamlensis]|uniref:Methyltransferase domain-containing protein n=1 Tax=Yoonia tamlensis TaxID=390270 RepID=A0A1I6FXK4_9RHOB|nr:class I SAM-dependent methyltransferase [Yoonia tamlensis]SFR34631.1 Methyltransferase domain-containing protein [Yoonia tamlensis]